MGLYQRIRRWLGVDVATESDRRSISLRDPELHSLYCGNVISSSKFNVLTFLPMNLWEQFHRPINLYFLVVAGIQFIPSIAPVSPYSTIFPIVIAFLINAVREGADDIRRYKSDLEANNRKYTLVGSGLSLTTVTSANIHVGDVVLLKPDEIVPADVVILSCSSEDGEVFVSTESLDGETGSKQKAAVLHHACGMTVPSSSSAFQDATETSTAIHNSQRVHMPAFTDEQSVQQSLDILFRSNIVLDSEGPNAHLHVYHGTMSVTYPAAAQLTPEALAHSTSEAPDISEQQVLFSSSSFAMNAPPFTGETKLIQVTNDNVILCSSMVRNTMFVLGMVVFTGRETKPRMTQRIPPAKWVLIDKLFNTMALIIFAFEFALVALFTILSAVKSLQTWRGSWYLGIVDHIPVSDFFPVVPLRFFTLVSPMVPLSFKVMVDISKVYISYSVRWDDVMRDDVGRTSVNNSALTEDLGQIEYILSDKTGTLTKNKMTFRALATADGSIFEDGPDAPLRTLLANPEGSPIYRHTHFLLQGMVFCNSIEASFSAEGGTQPGHSISNDWQSSIPWASCSPDEVALVEGASRCGTTLLTRTRHASTANVAGSPMTVTFMKSLSFTSARGMMSVLVRSGSEEPSYWLLTKGSDEKVLPLCESDERGQPQSCGAELPLEVCPRALLEMFAARGLRTLVYAYKTVPSDVASDWLHQVACAETTANEEERAHLLAAAHAEMESNLTFCGCTAVEDELQEDIQEVITSLREANIKIWMLTGDRSETARQTAIASGLLTDFDRLVSLTPSDESQNSLQTIRDVLTEMATELTPFPTPWWKHWATKVGLYDYACEFLRPHSASALYRPMVSSIFLSKEQSLEEFREHERRFSKGAITPDAALPSSTNYSIIISGATLRLLLGSGDPELLSNLKCVLLHANTVICSRTDPDQKAFIVETVRAAGKVTLAVGDGGNDVAMIQVAHIGVGIKGREGSQAALAADFSITQFKFLARLLLVHGHFTYYRTAMIVQQSFWKTVLIAWVQVLYNFYTEYSGMSFFDSYTLMIYNMIPTVPVTFLCVIDVPLSPSVLMKNPHLYQMVQRCRYLNPTTFFGYLGRALLHGTIVFYLSKGLQHGTAGFLQTGWPMDRGGDFYAAYISIVTIHSYTVLTESHSITFANWQSFYLSVWSCFLLLTMFASVPQANSTFLVLLRSASFYLSYLGITTVVCLSLALFATVKVMWFPDLLQLQRTVMLATKGFWRHGQGFPHLLDDNPSAFWMSQSPTTICCTSQHLSPLEYNDDNLTSSILQPCVPPPLHTHLSLTLSTDLSDERMKVLKPCI